MPQAAPTEFPTLSRCRHLALTTFRSHGQPVVTTVAFAHDGGRLYVALPANAEVVRRIRENAQVEVAPCHAEDGSPIEAMAIVLPDARSAAAKRALGGFSFRQWLTDGVLRLVGARRVYLEITPM
jgi:PPOX class probable F420-dependent enzyme